MRGTSTRNSKYKKSRPKIKLGIPDLEHSKAAVLRSLGSPDSRRGYQHAIDEFVAWYCSEPRLAFNKTVVLRYRFHLEERGLASGTINVRMAAVRRCCPWFPLPIEKDPVLFRFDGGEEWTSSHTGTNQVGLSSGLNP
jgi:hypothetical protein